MSTANVGIPVRVVKIQLGTDKVTCIDVTPDKARLARLLEVQTLQIHKVPKFSVEQAENVGYEPAVMASLLYRVMAQYNNCGMRYDKETVQLVAKRLTDTVNEVEPVDVGGRHGRRLLVE